jgi:hypothetical protein
MMGILAVIDTFLIYKICERRYDKKVAFVSSILFAVMPIMWILRFIWLDNILLPFLLSSILFAVYTGESTSSIKKGNENDKKRKSNKLLLIIPSGVLLGLTIFTKETAFIMIPLVGFLIFTNNNRSWKKLGIWLVPVILIPLIWPASLLSAGHFDNWLENVQFQTHRVSRPLVDTIFAFFKIDPVLISLAFMGLALAALKKDLFVLLWAIPFFIFYLIINYVQTLHLIVLLPLMCISAGILVLDISNKIQKKYQQTIMHSLSDDSARRVSFTFKKYLVNAFAFPSNLGLVIISVIAIFGLASTIMLVTLNLNSPYFQAVALVTNYLPGKNITVGQNDNKVTVISRVSDYIWIPENFFGKDQHVYQAFFWNRPIKTDKILLIVIDEYHRLMSMGDERAKLLRSAFDNTTARGSFERNSDYRDLHYYPFTSISDSYVLRSTGLAPGTSLGTIEIRANYSPP